MAKKSKGGNRGNGSGKNSQHTIRNNTKRKLRITGTTGASGKTSAAVLIVMPGQPQGILDTLTEKFPLSVEAITGKYLNFQSMKIEEMLERIHQFFKTMNITFELPKGSKDVVVIRELLTGPLERAEADLGNLAW